MKTRATASTARPRPLTATPQAHGTPCYVGVWVDDEPRVTVTRGNETVPLAPGEATTAFAWGFVGPACAQLALAILTDYLADEPEGEARALRLREEFHTCIVAGLPPAWALSGESIADFLAVVNL